MKHKKHWTQTARRRFAKHYAAKVAETIESPSLGIDLFRLNHLLDKTWSNLSIPEKVIAISSLTFDPSNPNED